MRDRSLTANVTSEILEESRVAAFVARKSVREWAGDAIEEYLEKHREKAKAGTLMPKRKR